MNEITFGYIAHEQFTYDNYYMPSVNAMLKYNDGKHKIDIISRSSLLGNPAANYNWIIDQCKTKYLILTHTDVTFSPDFCDRIFETIEYIPNFGALGIVGVDDNMQYRWGDEGKSFKVETLDCCCILINLEHGIRFDDKTFFDFHLYVENYCCEVLREKGLFCHTIFTNCAEMRPTVLYKDIPSTKTCYFNHHSYTLNQRGCAWGRYNEFKKILCKKWGYNVITT